MFDIGMSEMAIVGVVALIVVGPKDLPVMFRKVGQLVGKARGMARDFQRAMDQAAEDSGVGEINKSIQKASSLKNLGLDDATTSFQNSQTGSGKADGPKKIDAAAQHAARVKAAQDANKAGETWPHGDGDSVTPVATTETKKSPKKSVAKKASVKKPAAKKPVTKKTTVAKAPAAKKATPKTRAAAKPATGKATKASKADT